MLWWLAWGCVTDIPPAPTSTCTEDPPAIGVVVDTLTCRDRLPEDGAGVSVDTWVASPHLRMVLRHPVASRTLPGVGGGTVVDIAPWGLPDVAYEWAPLVDGGWLDVASMDIESDGVVVSGQVRSLPDRATPEGRRVSVRWRLDPDRPIVHLEGADGLWLHPLPHTTALGPGWVRDGVQVVTDAAEVEELGGALRLSQVERIAVAPMGSDAWLDHPTQRVDVDIEGADTLSFQGPDGVTSVANPGAVTWTVPSILTDVRGDAWGRASSPWRPLSDGAIRDRVGDEGSVWAHVDDAVGIASVAWHHADGRTGRGLATNGLAVLPTGSGDVSIAVSDGPGSVPVHRTVYVGDDPIRAVSMQVAHRFDHRGHVAIRWLTPGERDRGSRRPDDAHLADAIHSGSPVTVLAPRDDVADAQADPFTRHRNGARLTSVHGWSVAAWPWSAHPRRAGHGASFVGDRSPEEGLALAAQGPSLGRLTLVDAEWLRQADPDRSDVWPTGALLTDIGDVEAWYDWLNAGLPVMPAGPLTWVPVTDPTDVLAVEAEREWLAGRGVASTEGRLTLKVDGSPPGTVLQAGVPRTASVAVHTGGALTDVCLVVDGIQESCFDATMHSQLISVPADATWVVAVATGLTNFAVTAPVWFTQPLEEMPGVPR